MRNLFQKKSKWIDVGMYQRSGYLKLTQMRYGLQNNKKEFRTVCLGFVNNVTLIELFAKNVMDKYR